MARLLKISMMTAFVLLFSQTVQAGQVCDANQVMDSFAKKISSFSRNSEAWMKKWSAGKVAHPRSGTMSKDWVNFCMGGGLAEGANLLTAGNETWIDLGNRLQSHGCEPQAAFNHHGDRVLSLNKEVKKLKKLARCDDRG